MIKQVFHFTDVNNSLYPGSRMITPDIFDYANMPILNFSHIVNLTDDTGIIQHALHSIPNRKEGYCIDDNARALLLTVLASRQGKDQTVYSLMLVYLSFIHYMQTEDGYFNNFMSYTKNFADEKGSEDSFGRTMLALGYLINYGPNRLVIRTGTEIFFRACKHVHQLVSLRGIANSIIGICHVIKSSYPDSQLEETLISLSNKLVRNYQDNRGHGWHWFDNILTYDNAMLPLALFNAFEVTQNDTYFKIAMESMSFLESVVFHQGVLRPVGNEGWYKKGMRCAGFDQQGVDAMAMILLYEQVFRVTRDNKFLACMYQSYQWFLGLNDLNTSLYDASTGGCSDGLQKGGINYNQGAESTLAYWISHLVMSATLKDAQE